MIKKYSLKQVVPLAVVVCFAACTTSKPVTVAPTTPPPSPRPVMATETDSISYAIGVQVATYYKNQGLDTVSYDALTRAFRDVYTDSTLLLDIDQANMTLQEKLQEFMHRKLEKEKAKGQAFLDSNAKRPNVVTLPSGLQYEIIKRGDGPVPKAGDTVKANYIGTLVNGMEFDNSYKRGQPLEIPVTGVIPGWVEALQLMPVGSTWKLYIPSQLAYGDRGAGGAIPGGAALIFTIELLDIVKH